jgi:hypothetical protein
MVGAWALYELIEVARKVLLGLLVHVISRGNQRRVGRSVVIFSVLFPLLCGGALVLVPALGLAFASASVEALRERRSLDASNKGPWSQAIWPGTPVADDVVSVLVQTEPLMYRQSVRSSRQVKTRHRYGLLCRARWL